MTTTPTPVEQRQELKPLIQRAYGLLNVASCSCKMPDAWNKDADAWLREVHAMPYEDARPLATDTKSPEPDPVAFSKTVVELQKSLAAVIAERDAALADTKSLVDALRLIAEGNFGNAPWQADYAAIKDIAREALKGLADEG